MTNNFTPIETDGELHNAAQRLGCFVASAELINRSWRDALAAMAGIVVLQAVAKDGVIHYTALSENFAALSPGDQIPTYRAVLTRQGDEVWARWELADEPTKRPIHWES